MFFKKFSSAVAWSTSYLLTSTQFCFWSSLSRHSTNLAATWCMPKFSVRISWNVVFEIPPSSATADWNESLSELFGWFLHFFYVEGRSDRSMSSIEVRPSLKCLYQGLCSIHGFVPKCLFKHHESLSKVFSLIWNKISHKHFAHENHTFLFTEKFVQ